MEQPKYDNTSSIPAIEVSTRPADVDVAAPGSPKEQNPPAPIGNGAAKADEHDLQAMQDEGGNDEPARDAAKPATPALPERK